MPITYHQEDLSKYLDDYNYQPILTPKLDALSGEFDENTINEIALWKVDRYFALPGVVLKSLNRLNSWKQGEHRGAVDILSQLIQVDGVDIAMASTILRFRNPNVFQIIDRRAYRMVYGEKLKLYHSTAVQKKVDTYFDYLDKLIEISQEKSIAYQDLDRILYQMDIKLNGKL